MKIKIIDLLNNKANGEKIPQKIKYQGDIYELDYENCYKNTEGYFTDSIYYDLSNLNDEVEIIEDEEEIIEDEEEIDIQSIEEVNHYDVISAVEGKTEEHINDELELYSCTINEIIRAVKVLDKRTKEGN